MGITITVLKGTVPVPGAKVSLSVLPKLGILSSVTNLTSVSGSDGKSSFQPGWDIVGYTWTASTTVGIDYGSASGTADGFGDGSGTIVIKVDPLGQISHAVSSGFWTLVLLGFLALIVILVMKVLSTVLGGFSPGNVVGNLHLGDLWAKFKEKTKSVSDRIQFKNGY